MYRLKRNKRPIYLCNKTIENDRIIFTEPVKHEMDYQPLITAGEVITAGPEYINRLVVYTSLEEALHFHNADRCYVFVKKPEEYDKFCNTADFYVDGEPLLFLNEARFYLQRMVGDNDE
jgi:hypothetical protein